MLGRRSVVVQPSRSRLRGLKVAVGGGKYNHWDKERPQYDKAVLRSGPVPPRHKNFSCQTRNSRHQYGPKIGGNARSHHGPTNGPGA